MPAAVILAATFFMSHGARNWPFLTLIARAGRGGGDQEVGLAAQEGRDLQDVGGLGVGAHCSGSCTSVRTGSRSVSRISARIGSAGLQADAARARQRGAVRLVERGLVDEPDAEPAGDLDQRRADLQRMRPAFQRAGARDQHERQVVADPNFPDRHMTRIHQRPFPISDSPAITGARGSRRTGSGSGDYRGIRCMIAPAERCEYNPRIMRGGGFAMIRFTALLVAASVLALSVPSRADGVQSKSDRPRPKKSRKSELSVGKLSSRKGWLSRKMRRRRSSSRPLHRPSIQCRRFMYGCRGTGPGIGR